MIGKTGDARDIILNQEIYGYGKLLNNEFEKSIEFFKQVLSVAQSIKNYYMIGHSLLNLSIANFYYGKISNSFNYISESLGISQSLIENKENCSIYSKTLYVRVLTNFCILNIFMNLCDDALAKFETLMSFINNNLEDESIGELFEIVTKSFLFHNFTEIFTQDLIFKKIDNKIPYGSYSYILLKSFAMIYFGFLQYLKNEKNLDYFIKCQQDSITSLNILNEKELVSIPLINLSLLKIIKQDMKISKEIFIDFLNIFKYKNKDKFIEFDTYLENLYSKIINEQYQKFETAKIIFNKLKTFNESHEKKILLFENIRDIDSDLKTFINQTIEKQTLKINSLEKIFYPLLLSKLRNELYDVEDISSTSAIERINLSLEILKNFNYYCLIKIDERDLSIDTQPRNYFISLLNNLVVIYKKSKLKNFLKKFMKSTIKYSNIKDYRQYINKSIIEPRIKKYFYMCLDNFKSYGYLVTKFNFNSNGKKDRYVKFNVHENKGEIIFSESKQFSNIIKTIDIGKIQNVVYGANTCNMKNKFQELKRSKFKKPWLYISLVYFNEKNSFSQLQTVDLFINDDNTLNEIIFSFSLIKYMYHLNEMKISSNMNFSIMKIKYKMIHAVKKYYVMNLTQKNKSRSEIENDIFVIENCWSFIKLFLFMKLNKISFDQNS